MPRFWLINSCFCSIRARRICSKDFIGNENISPKAFIVNESFLVPFFQVLAVKRQMIRPNTPLRASPTVNMVLGIFPSRGQAKRRFGGDHDRPGRIADADIFFGLQEFGVSDGVKFRVRVKQDML